MNLEELKRVYFIGIGGIGMSALARYFISLGKSVAGYDRSFSKLTEDLIRAGAIIHFNDDRKQIPHDYLDTEKISETLVVYTPAVPDSHEELNYFREMGYAVKKRSEILGMLAEGKTTIAVAGTHGKTTISAMIAYILSQCPGGCNALLGGISKNFNSNMVLSARSDLLVTEADEFDRSFLKLYPDLAIISSLDADHLDIYGTLGELKIAFRQFASQVRENGVLVVKKDLEEEFSKSDLQTMYCYSGRVKADFYSENVRLEEGKYLFDFNHPEGQIRNVLLGQPGLHNVENAVAALAVCWLTGIEPHILVNSLRDFKGIRRRFDIHISGEKTVYIDDYAHHPEEIRACIQSARGLFPEREMTVVFQPHLFSRTRDLAQEFAESLSLADKLILLDIYPAREEPIEGISSEVIFDRVETRSKTLCSVNELMECLSNLQPQLLITMGAGNIDEFVEPIKNLFS
jgi:UDP-N-acetylmuramate--alanine ligase